MSARSLSRELPGWLKCAVFAAKREIIPIFRIASLAIWSTWRTGIFRWRSALSCGRWRSFSCRRRRRTERGAQVLTFRVTRCHPERSEGPHQRSHINEPPEALVRAAAEELSHWRDERCLVPNFWDGTAAVPPCYWRDWRAVVFSSSRVFTTERNS